MKNFMHFAILRSEGFSEKAIQAVQSQLKDVDRALGQFDEHIDAELGRTRLSPASKNFLRQQWYGDPIGSALSLGNRAVHRAAMIASIAIMLRTAGADRAARKGVRRLRMLTTAPNLGITEFDAPMFDLVAIRQNFDVAARRGDVDALGFLDLAVVEEARSLEPLRLSAHMHAAARARSMSFKTKIANACAGPSKNPRNELGLLVAKFTAKRRSWGPGLNRSLVAYLGYYIRKITCGLKVVFTNAQGKRVTKTTLRGWTRIHAFRQLECWMHFDLLETTVGVGTDGRRWRKEWKHLVLRLLGCPNAGRGLHIAHEQLESAWRRIWDDLGGVDLHAVRIVKN